MGWAAGSGLACEVWDKVRAFVPEDKRQKVAKEIFELFSERDADDWDSDDDLVKDAQIPWLMNPDED